MTSVRFDDIAGLQALISNDYGPWSKTRLIRQDDIDTFGRLTHDMQWIHVDPARAKAESPFGATIAHGFLVLSLLSDLRKTDNLEITGHGNALNYGIDRLRFIRPVLVGSEIRCRTRIANITEKSGGTMIDFDVAVHVAGEDEPCLVFAWKLFYRP